MNENTRTATTPERTVPTALFAAAACLLALATTVGAPATNLIITALAVVAAVLSAQGHRTRRLTVAQLLTGGAGLVLYVLTATSLNG